MIEEANETPTIGWNDAKANENTNSSDAKRFGHSWFLLLTDTKSN